MSISNSQDVGIELEPLSPSQGNRSQGLHVTIFNTRRIHSRSASWSLPGGQSSELGRSLGSLNPITPITSAIRGIVPSFRYCSGRNESDSMHLSPNNSQPSLMESSEFERGSEVEDLGSHQHDSLRTFGDTSSNVNVHLSHEHTVIPMGPPENIGVETSDETTWLEQNVIFIILLLFKFAWYHRSGLMIILGMFGTFFHCNQVLCNQVALKNRRQVSVLFLVVMFLAANIYFVYYVFWEQRLHFCLVFLAPHFTVDLWNLIWSIWVTDYIIRFGTIGLKAAVAAIFLPILPTRKKGKYYMLLEYISQFYRTLVPTPLWVRYLSNPMLSGAVFAVLITAAYLMIKGAIIFSSLRDLYQAFVMFLKDQLYGRSPSTEELASVTQQCAICQEDFNGPIILPCHHIFCENCVLQWFDRQNTCPLCRTTIGNHNPKWRDGSTSTWPQIF